MVLKIFLVPLTNKIQLPEALIDYRAQCSPIYIPACLTIIETPKNFLYICILKACII